jgi:hypothetical protein
MRIFYTGFLLGIFFLCIRIASAQVVVEESIKTDSIDIFASAQTKAPSITVPLVATAIMPGLGHQMLKKEKRAIAFLSADALLIFGMIFCEITSQATLDNAKAFAYAYAGAQGGAGADKQYWSNVSKYMDSNGLDALSAGFNQTQEISRTYTEKYSADNLQWRWLDEDRRKDFGKQLFNSTQFHVAATFCLSALIANRVISLIDLRVNTRQRAITGHVSAAPALRLQPMYDAGRNEPGLKLCAAF